jgi:hypothetical protein
LEWGDARKVARREASKKGISNLKFQISNRCREE